MRRNDRKDDFQDDDRGETLRNNYRTYERSEIGNAAFNYLTLS